MLHLSSFVKNIKSFIKRSGYLMKLVYLMERAAYYLYRWRVVGYQKCLIERKNVKVLLIHSKQHFDPSVNSVAVRDLARSGAAKFAEWLFGKLDDYQLTYIDFRDELPAGLEPDIVVGIASRTFNKACKQFKSAKKILWAVNCHPLYRLSRLLAYTRQVQLGIGDGDIQPPFVVSQSVALADDILLLGNQKIKDTYTDFGIRAERVHLVSGWVDEEVFRPRSYLQNIDTERPDITVVYPTGFVGLRKGLFRFLDVWEKVFPRIPNLRLVVLGNADGGYAERISEVNERCKNITVSGWLTQQQHLETLQSADLVSLLSLEEGRVYSVLEAISCGCVPFISDMCGIDLPGRYVVSLAESDQSIAQKFIDLVENLAEEKPRNAEISRLLRLQANLYDNDAVLDRLLK
jgi:glycosyltransferase involved in cell wall biosynthesis